MTRILFIVYINTLSINYCWSQSVSINSVAGKNNTSSSINIHAGNLPIGNGKNAATAANVLQDVLFATNEDCELYINEELKGTVSKTQHKYIKLEPGRYVYKAKSKSTQDELKENLIVTASGFNEVFIDMLYFIDEMNLQKQNLKKVNATASRPVASNESKPVAVKPEEGKGVVNTFLSNVVPIKGGNFVMGNNRAPSEDEAEHPVTINSILFSKYEVTQEQWENLMGYNPSLNKGCNACPVENVSWEEVMKFIRKLNVLSNKKFRLPTEAEWEYAARIGGREEIEQAGGPEEYIKKTAWYFANSDKKTHPVGQKQPNAAGIYDLLGNVAEWCSDWYGSNYYKEDNNQINPEGPPLGKEKVVRGGTFNDYSGDRFRPSLRNKLKPTSKSGDVGFRLVLEVD